MPSGHHPMGGHRFSLATNAERVCAEIILKQKDRADDDSKKSHPALALRSREYDVGGDREPEGVIADNLYFDEHANDRKDHQHERKHKPEVHCAYLLALRRNAKNLAWSLAWSIATVNVRDPVASSKATSEICGPRSMLSHSQFACAFACGARVEDCDAGLDCECCLLPRTSDSSHCAMLPKRTSDSGIFEGFSWSV